MNSSKTDEQTVVDSISVASPSLFQRGFLKPAAGRQGPGVGTPWLHPESTRYTPAGGADPEHPHLFHLQGAPADLHTGGSLQSANRTNWPILQGQKAATHLAHLTVGGIREPHWNPSTWELNFIISGTARWSILKPNSSQEVFEGGPGDIMFAPRGHLHYFENASATEDLFVLIVFNLDATEYQEDVSLVLDSAPQSGIRTPSSAAPGRAGLRSFSHSAPH